MMGINLFISAARFFLDTEPIPSSFVLAIYTKQITSHGHGATASLKPEQ